MVGWIRSGADDVRIGADLAPLGAARVGAEFAMTGSRGDLVATDSFLGRAVHEAGSTALGVGGVLTSRISPADASTNLGLYRIASS